MSSSATSGRCSRAAGHDLVAPAHLGDHLDVLLEVEQRPQRPADQGLVLGQQHPDHRLATGSGTTGVLTGTSAPSRKPPAGGRAGRQPAAQRLDPLGQPGQPGPARASLRGRRR